MSVRHTLLGLLLERPAYPYELGNRLEERFGPAWKINSGQLYRTCKSLEAEGLIERVDAAKDDQTERHIVTITDDGAVEYGRWFSKGARRPQLLRRDLMAKITLAGPERLKDTLADVDGYERECVACLRDHIRLRETIPLEGLRVRADHVLLRLNLNATIRQLEAELGWAREAQERVTWLADQDAIWLPRRESPPARSAVQRIG